MTNDDLARRAIIAAHDALRERLAETLFYTAPNGKTIFRWADPAIALEDDPHLADMLDALLPAIREHTAAWDTLRLEIAAALILHDHPEQNSLTRPDDPLVMLRADPEFHVCSKALAQADALLPTIREHVAAAVQAERERRADLQEEYGKREESQDRIRERLTRERDNARAQIHYMCSEVADAAGIRVDSPSEAVDSVRALKTMADDRYVQRDRAETAEARVELASRDADYLGARIRRAEAAIKRARPLAEVSTWHVYESQDTGDVYPASAVRDLMADIRAALDGTEATDPDRDVHTEYAARFVDGSIGVEQDTLQSAKAYAEHRAKQAPSGPATGYVKRTVTTIYSEWEVVTDG